MNVAIAGLILIFIIYKAVINSKNGKTKKVKEGIMIVPLIFLYLSVEQMSSVQINIMNLSVIAISIVIGALIGLFRAKFYEVMVNSDGEIVYKRHIFDILILIIYIIIKIVLEFSVGYFDKNLVNSIEAAALFMATASIAVRRIKIYTDYLRLKGKMNG